MTITTNQRMFIQTEEDLGTRLLKALGRPKYKALDPSELQHLNAVYHFANNPCARVRFARIFVSSVINHLTSGPNQQHLRCEVYLVTFALKRFCCSLKDADCYDLRPLQAWVREVMGDLSYIGMVEAALYTNKSLKLEEREPTVSWHVHILAWDVTRAKLRGLVDEISTEHQSLIEGLPAADYRRVAPVHLASKALYMLKSPREYRIWPKKEEVVDTVTGEIEIRRTGRFRQKSRLLRRREQIQMFEVMRDRYLDWMMVGGGAGRELLLSIRNTALKPLRLRERKRS
jgi:hypothetical protein